MTSVCLIEDDPIMGESLKAALCMEGLEVDWLRRGVEAAKALRRRRYALAVCDIRLSDLNGDRLYESLRAEGRALPPFIFITAYGDVERAVYLLKLGAVDYLVKPFDLNRFLARVAELLCLSSADGAGAEPNQLGVSPAMRRIEAKLRHLANFDHPVLVTGETGVGKEVVVRYLHRLGRGGPFEAINCTAIPENLVETELFGYEKGAFTGAGGIHRGAFERARGGTLLLDEIGDMPPATQAKLLRVLQDRSLLRVGGECPISLDVRLVFATHQDLAAEVAAGRFREDLYYRIHVVHLHLPPLRARSEDIGWLADHLLRDYAKTHAQPVKQLGEDALGALHRHPWPGNARELRFCLERACIFSTGNLLGAADLFPVEDETPAVEPRPRTLAQHLAECERCTIVAALAARRGHLGETSRQLGISRKSLWERMKRLGVSKT